MKFTKEDKRDLLKLADIIEKKEFFNKTDENGELGSLPENKRDGNQFSLKEYFFGCGMPACVAGNAVCEFPERFGYDGYVREKRSDKTGKRIYVNHTGFALAFNLRGYDSLKITDVMQYPGGNPKPKTVANKIRMIVKKQEVYHE